MVAILAESGAPGATSPTNVEELLGSQASVLQLTSHLRTLLPYARHALFGVRAPAATPWATEFEDPELGVLRLTGELRDRPGSNELFLFVHGLGGSPASPYCRRAAAIAASTGASSLALALRGADRRGEDFYNVALTSDLHAALASPRLARFEHVFLVGFSMGGYVALHYACEPADERVRAVAALCTPLDLSCAQRHIDAPAAYLYRRHVLNGLISIYEAVARKRAVPTSPDRVRRVRTIYEWDELTIVPRYGFDSPEHYYAELDVARRFESLALPTLLVASSYDPVIPASTIRPFLPAKGGPEVAWVERGGHVSFPGPLDLGVGAQGGIEHQVFHWLRRQASVSGNEKGPLHPAERVGPTPPRPQGPRRS